MISISYRGGTGNRLFQHAYGRLLADYLKQSFRASDAIEMFPELPTAIGPENNSFGAITIHQTSKHDQVLTFDRVARTCEGFDVFFEAYFEVGSIYYPYASIIRSWFPKPGPTIPGTAIHVRGGDGEHNSPPMQYYGKALELANDHRRCTVFTDDPSCAIAKGLAAIGYPVLSDSPTADFEAMRRHERIIIGNSTFAWWAAFLSNAVQVIQPEPLSGFRSKEVPNSYLKVQAWQQIQY